MARRGRLPVGRTGRWWWDGWGEKMGCKSGRAVGVRAVGTGGSRGPGLGGHSANLDLTSVPWPHGHRSEAGQPSWGCCVGTIQTPSQILGPQTPGEGALWTQ